jgi:hypothetical protein
MWSMGDQLAPGSRFFGRWPTAANWVGIATLLTAACGFPRPADVGDDAAAGCTRDQDCGATTPFCVDTTCVVCKASASCPAERPVCDTIRHDCRSCEKDSECDSGACDIAAGACIGQGSIRYASPTGSNADPCTKTTPCSLQHAAELVDTAHSYVVLVPGRYEQFFGFSAQTATIVGNNATLAFTSTAFGADIRAGSSIAIRNIILEEPPDVLADGVGWILVANSKLDIDNIQSDAKSMAPLSGRGGDTITMRRSSFTGLAPDATRLVADACIFHTGGPGVGGSIELTNSVVIADSTSNSSGVALGINASGANPTSKISNNTFFRGSVFCTGTAAQFINNIFYNHTSIGVGSGCAYQYNLVTPILDLGGSGNTTGDPMFVDAAHGDLHLKLGSAAIDAGDPSLVLIDRDFDGTHRPQGTRSDIGAFEYVP